MVTRYFGGTKLGAGGLVRAYSGAVSEGLKAIGIAECRLEDQLALTFDYAHVGKVEYFCQTQNIPIVDKVFLNNVQFTCSLPVQEVEAFQKPSLNSYKIKWSLRALEKCIQNISSIKKEVYSLNRPLFFLVFTFEDGWTEKL